MRNVLASASSVSANSQEASRLGGSPPPTRHGAPHGIVPISPRVWGWGPVISVRLIPFRCLRLYAADGRALAVLGG